ncbi:50S ribosomal protein L23 [candidate division WWE3 bacterium RIFCSPHIGHO2_01_FULL_40_23]|uniref:Large ribosomal subunit protein uL23 n=1 Tax=candidate division WWE3 bacterium RIFCSPLOWO2_01_FULL_41_18 TaxID=1802625 RepID=A0A1F4VE09_UNCKA|nr:MAG: 50S ribosomal protein L23 [candidate division WWE3 bacterium RIFCSPHIGHO2_01_FULL_40_23]OGC55170.1 MAG: 50S ribosomal protein L23 [candidate division WWE3 bacterium RIFCSPLOWO2_01_FULL_41_18]
MRLNNFIKRPVITEKTTSLVIENKYVFEVPISCSKGAVSKAVKDLFGVDAVKVTTQIVPGKQKKMLKGRKYVKLPKWKKAVVTLKKGQSIKLFESK